ncbi:MAG: hypothetical protein J3R72DRAFT_465195 [Linnemannia gamsii]|nr:MAG: hypothetical protein J3R72DRAFT_465195 [Linnemannia gamsii]
MAKTSRICHRTANFWIDSAGTLRLLVFLFSARCISIHCISNTGVQVRHDDVTQGRRGGKKQHATRTTKEMKKTVNSSKKRDR